MTQVKPITDASGQIVTPATKEGGVVKWLNDNRKGIRLPANIDLDRLKFATTMAIRRNPSILNCKTDSILDAVLQIAMYGLYPGPMAHLVPFGEECVPILDYKGFAHLMIDAGAKKIEARVVREGDLFEYSYGTDPHITHVPQKGKDASAAPVTHAYAIVWLPSGEQQFDVMDRKELDKLRSASPAIKKGRSSPWNEWYEEMAKKSPVRRISKMLHKGSEFLVRATEFEERFEAHLPLQFEQDRRAIEAATAEAPPTDGAGDQPETPAATVLVCPLHDVPWIENQHGWGHPTGKRDDYCNPGRCIREIGEGLGWNTAPNGDLNRALRLKFNTTSGNVPVEKVEEVVGWLRAGGPSAPEAPVGEPEAETAIPVQSTLEEPTP